MATAVLEPPTTITLQNDDHWNGYKGTADSYINRWWPSGYTNYGKETYLVVRGSDRLGITQEALVNFNLDKLPADAYIISATLSLYSGARDHNAPTELRVYQLKRFWKENEVNFNQASKQDNWQKSGATGAQDRVTTPLDSKTIDYTYNWVNFDVTKALQDWYSQPVAAAAVGRQVPGFIIQAFNVPGKPAVSHHFISSNDRRDSLRPKLQITYQCYKPTPTPLPPTPTLPPPTPTVVVLVQNVDGYHGYSDTYLDGFEEKTRPHNTTYLSVVSPDDSGARENTLLRVDLSYLPPDSTIYSAELKLWSGAGAGGGQRTLEAVPLLRSWSQTEATWYGPFAGQQWAAPGAEGRNADYAPMPVATTTLTGPYRWYTLDITAAVQEWVSHPNHNHGLLLHIKEPRFMRHHFVSGDYPNPTYRPHLRLHYLPGMIQPQPTPTPTATTGPTATPTPTVTPTPRPGQPTATLPPPPPPNPQPTPWPTTPPSNHITWKGVQRPGIYMAYDYSGHNSNTYGIAGSMIAVHWATLEPSEGRYDFHSIDSFLAKVHNQGGKGSFFITSYEGGCSGSRAMPDYLRNDRSATVTYRCGGGTAILPKYWSERYLSRYHALINALGNHYKNDSRVEFVAIGTGAYGETRAATDSAGLNALAAAGLNSTVWVNTVNQIADWYKAAFSDGSGHLLKALLQQSAPVSYHAWERREFNQHALDIGIGISTNNLYPDGEGVLYIGDSGCPNCSWYDYPIQYWRQMPTAWEGYNYMTCNSTLLWWALANVLDKHPVYLRPSIDLYFSGTRPRWDNINAFKWAANYLGRTPQDAPSAWVALREHRDPWTPNSCRGDNRPVAHQHPQWGNYSFFLYQEDGLPGGRTVPETNDRTVNHLSSNYQPYNPAIPAGTEGWVVRRTDAAHDNRYMYFKVDSQFLSGNHSVTIRVTYADVGNDSWSLHYLNDQGHEAVARVTGGQTFVRKQNSRTWKIATFVISDARFVAGLPQGQGGADFYIDSNNDGDEWIHFVDVRK